MQTVFHLMIIIAPSFLAGFLLAWAIRGRVKPVANSDVAALISELATAKSALSRVDSIDDALRAEVEAIEIALARIETRVDGVAKSREIAGPTG